MAYTRGSKLIDLSHDIENGMETYPGLPGPLICDFLSREASRSKYAEGTEFQIGKMELVGNTGTYLDSPFHRYAGGKDLSELPLERLANLDAIVIRAAASPRLAISSATFRGLDVRGKAVLVQTGWSRHWRTPEYFAGAPFLTEDAARLLRDEGAALVGIDSLNIDSIDDRYRPVHTILLGSGIPIVEHMTNLDFLNQHDRLRFFATPPKVKGFGTFPVRAFVIVG